ncbi:MAG: hypothetical protein Q9223_006900 [Gallowayella weberi]
MRQTFSSDWVRWGNFRDDICHLPEETKGETLQQVDQDCGYRQKNSISAEEIERDLEGASVHGENTAVEKEDGEFDKAKAETLKESNCTFLNLTQQTYSSKGNQDVVSFPLLPNVALSPEAECDDDACSNNEDDADRNEFG